MSWQRALVTGASSGIGEAIARELAADSTDLVIVARNTERLTELAKELSSVDVEVLSADLGDAAALADVEKRLGDESKPIDLLVNNAGFGTAGNLVDLPIDGQCGMIDVHITALVRLSHAAAQAMVRQGFGAILQVSAVGGSMPGPGMATYCATKAFVNSFSQSLHEELRNDGVTVTTVAPGFTATEFHERMGCAPSTSAKTAKSVAQAALAAAAKGRVHHTPGAKNKVFVGLAKIVPHRVVRALTAAWSRLRASVTVPP